MKLNISKAILASFLFFQFSIIGFNQVSPGGVGTTNLTAWFKPDNLNLGNVTSWTTTYPAGAITLTDPAAPYPQLVNTPTGAVSNYNKTLQFSGNSFIGLNTTSLQGLSTTSTLNLLDNAYSSSRGSFFHAYYLPQPVSSNGHMMIYNESSDGIQLRNLGAIGRLAIGKLSSNTVNASRDWTDGYEPSIISYTGNRSNSTSMKAYYKGDLLPTPSVASQSTGNNGLYFGYSPNIPTSAFNGFLHEYIFFNVDLTEQELSRVHSYLAIKYGATLGNTGGGINGDYLATNNSILWDADLNAIYHNDVIGIGRDDIEALYQRQSHAFDDSCRIYLATLAATNEANTGSFNNDISYLLMGHNNAALCGTTASNTEIPAGITSRIAREFKVTKTNITENVGWDVKLDTCSSIENTIDISQVRLLVDSDGDFSNAQSFGTTEGLTISVANGTVSIQNITEAMIPNNETRYITIAYIDVSYTIAGSGPICEGETGYVVFDLINATGPVSIEYTDGTTTQTISNVADGDTLFLNPTNTTIYTFTPFVGLINCCGLSTQTYQQIVNQAPTVSINASANSLCFGEDLQLFGAGADSYVWDNGVTDGISFTPTVGTNTYEVVGTDLNGCENNASITIDVHALPTVSINGPTSACEGDEITLSGAGANTYIWDNGVIDGTPFTLQTTTTFEVTGTDLNACVNTNTITVSVLASPEIEIDGLTEICEGEEAEFTASGAQTYVWDNNIQNGVPFFQTTIGNQTYTVIATDNNGCSTTETVNLEVIKAPKAIVFPSATEGIGSLTVEFQNSSLDATNYFWDFGNGDTSTDEQVFPVDYNQIGEYFVTLTAFNGICEDTWSQLVKIIPADAFINLPNVCTPNNDGSNDIYTIDYQNIETIDGSILNRWGNTVFTFNSPDFIWDPIEVSEGVYTITYTAIGLNEKTYKGQGFIQIIK